MMEFPEWWENELKNVGKKYKNKDTIYVLEGVMDSGEDYYYVLYPKDPAYSVRFLSCVGDFPIAFEFEESK